jgi:hypothetical protein
MANNIFQVKRTSTTGRTPNTTNSSNTQYINAGELALNMTDKILYTSDGTNLILVGSNTTSLNVTGNVTLSTTTGISANGTYGTANQVLTTNGTAVYWAAAAAGVNVASSYAFTNTTASGNATSGAITTAGGIGVANNLYVGGRVGWSNSTNVSVVYQYYNSTTNSLDTVFG